MTRVTLRKAQAGVLLLEALVAILIFSIGILAIVGLQGTAVQNATDAKYRSEAAFLAGELMGQIWADAPNVASYAWNGIAAKPARIDGPTGWIAHVQGRLPDAAANPPTIVVTADPTLGNIVDITVRWRMPAEAAANLPAHQHTVRLNINTNPP